ncbi:WD40 repeat protein [Moumouvirus australiensis]|uniref:WD40 repeat protein n=1 Tax=Moumouvirus australiensis TaxID=2109587 RepID=A0A2P1EMS3_9VIRU|nr:WD40 repeat protein [Moumouvirus australiensis]AVL95205.1 WD40 repeat protein [Moumouvirus australiensis]
MEKIQPLINIKLSDPFVCVQISTRVDILSKCPYFIKMFTHFKESQSDEILMEVVDSRLIKIIIQSLSNKELNIYDPINGPKYSKWKYLLLLYTCCDFLGVNFDKSVLYDLSVHKVGFDLLLNVIDMIGYDKLTIQLLINNLPPDYNLRKFPRELLRAIKLQPTSYIIATGSEDRTIKLHRISTKKSRKNKYVTRNTFDKNIRYYPTKMKYILSNKIVYVSYLDKNQIISCDHDNILRIWDIVTGDLTKEIFETQNNIINSVVPSPDRKICGFDGNNIKFFDLNTCTWTNIFINLRIKINVNMCWLSNTKIILGYNDGIIEIHDIENNKIIKSWEAFDEPIDKIYLSPDGSQFAVSSCRDNYIKIYDSNNYELITFIESDNNIENFTYSPIDDLIVSISWSNVIEIWNCRTGLIIEKFENYHNYYYDSNKNNIKYICFSPTGEHLIVFTINQIKLLHWESGNEILSFDTHEISDMCLVPDFNNSLINRIDKILN